MGGRNAAGQVGLDAGVLLFGKCKQQQDRLLEQAALALPVDPTEALERRRGIGAVGQEIGIKVLK